MCQGAQDVGVPAPPCALPAPTCQHPGGTPQAPPQASHADRRYCLGRLPPADRSRWPTHRAVASDAPPHCEGGCRAHQRTVAAWAASCSRASSYCGRGGNGAGDAVDERAAVRCFSCSWSSKTATLRRLSMLTKSTDPARPGRKRASSVSGPPPPVRQGPWGSTAYRARRLAHRQAP
jgi:hypothetical protein